MRPMTHVTTSKIGTKIGIARAPALAALLLGLAGTLLPGGAARADSLSAKADAFLAPVLAAKPAPGWSPVILRIDGGFDSAKEAHLKSLGADVTRRLPLLHYVAANVPTRSLRKVAALPFVLRLSSDLPVRKCDGFTEGSSGDTSAYQQYGLTGQGVITVVIDSGVSASPDLNGRLYSAVSFVSGDSSTDDKCGHGTHVAGILAGSGAASTGPGFKKTFHGIARGAYIGSVRVLDQQGMGTVSSVLSGIQYVIGIKNQYKYNQPVVMNLSLGHPVGESYTTDPLCQAVETAWKGGIVVVCAAGNSGRASATNKAGAANEGWGTAYGSIQSPGNDPYVITVGATKSIDGNRAHDKIATYSSRGPSRLDLILKPDIIAPGNKVISLDTPGSYLATQYASKDQIPMSSYESGTVTGLSSDYMQLSGTSMATPVVAGAAALLLQANPNLSPDTVKARLMISADKWAAPDASGNPNGAADPCTYGAGYLNIPAALACTAVAGQPALSPALTEDAAGNVYLDSSKIVGASHVIWGTSVTDLHVIWGTTALTGSSLLSASHVIWGTSVWSDHVIWGTSTDAVDLMTAVNGE